MNWENIVEIFDSTFLNTVAVTVVGVLAYWIGRMQARIQDSVELYASFGIIKNATTESETPIIHVQNTGTRTVYFDSYNFNGRVYELNGQVRPPTYSNALNNFYRIELPINGESHVSLFINFHDFDGRNWQSKIVCQFQDGWWDIKNFPSKLLRKKGNS